MSAADEFSGFQNSSKIEFPSALQAKNMQLQAKNMQFPPRFQNSPDEIGGVQNPIKILGDKGSALD